MSPAPEHLLLGTGLTLAAYLAALRLQRRIGWLHPLLVCSGTVVAVILLVGIDYGEYRSGAEPLVFLLGPATVALAVPVYKHGRRLKRQLPALLAATAAGSLCGIGAAWAMVLLLGGSAELVTAMAPKSATVPIAFELLQVAGGAASLGVLLTVLTGLTGAVFGPPLLRRLGWDHDLVIGSAVGTAAHGIGTATVIRTSELQGSVAACSMGLTGIWTTFFFLPLIPWLST